MLAPGFRRVLTALSLVYLLAPLPQALAQTPAAANATAHAAVASDADAKANAKADAKAKVPASDKFKTIVWSSFSSGHVYHLPASKYYGKTKHGAYACEKDAAAFGYHASKK
jgi:hypothetical protein